ncbi:MAG: hypothetical protein Q7T81_02330 [Pseudolabrys sp.]|nr:hypothetical protein [Pseudolabrys sp.]
MAIGAAMIGYGIPNNEFGIGNTLIVAGTTAVVGGLIISALGMAVSSVQKLTDALATRPAVRASRPFDTFDPAVVAAAAGRPQQAAPAAPVPFPPKSRPAPRPPEARPEPEPRFAPPAPAFSPLPDRDSNYSPPYLPNPDEPPVAQAEEAYLSPLPQEPEAPQDFELRDRRADLDPPIDLDAVAEKREEEEQAPDLDQLPPPAAPRKSNTYFDAMWPAEPKSEPKSEPQPDPQAAEPELAEPEAPEPAPKPEPKPSAFHWSNIRRGATRPVEPEIEVREPLAAEVPEAIPEPADEPPEPEAEEPRTTVAILKSGVVDGMGYTLYVDGSIEAELPQGTLRFASINELRAHLEKTS